jgi:hypothetical protein
MTATWSPSDVSGLDVRTDAIADPPTVELPVLRVPAQRVPAQQVPVQRVPAQRSAQQVPVQRVPQRQAAARRGRVRAVALAVAISLVLVAGTVASVLLGAEPVGESRTGGGAASAAPVPPAEFPVTGTVTLTGPSVAAAGASCAGTGGYADVREGATVTIADAAGTVVATGTLGRARADSPSSTSCAFPFTVARVPSGSRFYLVEVGHHGAWTYSGAYLSSVGAALQLGG